jgi:hypothetical protein
MNRTSLGSARTEKVPSLEAPWGLETPEFAAVQNLVKASLGPYLDLNNRIAEMVQEVAVPSKQLAAFVANPVIEQVTAPLREMVKELGGIAAARLAASIEVPYLPEVLPIHTPIAKTLEEAAAAVARLAIGSLPDLTRQWEQLLPRAPQLPELKFAETNMKDDSGDRLELMLPAVTHESPASLVFTREEWILIAKVSLSIFILAHLAFSPEWRRHLGDYFWFLYALAMAWVFALSKEE